MGIDCKYYKIIQKAIDYCNLNSDDDDIIYKAIYKYKKLRELDEESKDLIYEIIASSLGY